MKRCLGLASAGLLLALPLAGMAQDMGLLQGDPSALLAQADTNHDGKISRDEFLAARAAQFDRLDRDHDGYLAETDAAALPERAQRGFHMLLNVADTDGDGRVSRAEWNAMPARGFDRIDANHDGVLDADELAQAKQRGAQFLRRRAGN